MSGGPGGGGEATAQGVPGPVAGKAGSDGQALDHAGGGRGDRARSRSPAAASAATQSGGGVVGEGGTGVRGASRLVSVPLPPECPVMACARFLVQRWTSPAVTLTMGCRVDGSGTVHEGVFQEVPVAGHEVYAVSGLSVVARVLLTRWCLAARGGRPRTAGVPRRASHWTMLRHGRRAGSAGTPAGQGLPTAVACAQRAVQEAEDLVHGHWRRLSPLYLSQHDHHQH
jgi:hypothetical protein